VRKGGMALLGGGFGKFTPESMIEKIKRRSRDLNLMIGKTEIDKDQLVQDLQKSKAKGRFEFFFEGGLWVVMKK
jgi:acyl CoA:acetate/3-ketoacid CoA transferase alpha subunit